MRSCPPSARRRWRARWHPRAFPCGACRPMGAGSRRRSRPTIRRKAAHAIVGWNSPLRASARQPRLRRQMFRRERAPASCRRRQQSPQAVDRTRFDLANALGGDTVLVSELVKRGLVLTHPAALQDGTAAVVEPLECFGQLLGGSAAPLLTLGLL